MGSFKNIKCASGEIAADYQAYLRTKHWSEVRLSVIKSRGNECERCFNLCASPHIHHKHYKNLGKEKMDDVLLLCNSCHTLLHKKRRGAREQRRKSLDAQMKKIGKPSVITNSLLSKLSDLDEAQMVKVIAFIDLLREDNFK